MTDEPEAPGAVAQQEQRRSFSGQGRTASVDPDADPPLLNTSHESGGSISFADMSSSGALGGKPFNRLSTDKDIAAPRSAEASHHQLPPPPSPATSLVDQKMQLAAMAALYSQTTSLFQAAVVRERQQQAAMALAAAAALGRERRSAADAELERHAARTESSRSGSQLAGLGFPLGSVAGSVGLTSPSSVSASLTTAAASSLRSTSTSSAAPLLSPAHDPQLADKLMYRDYLAKYLAHQHHQQQQQQSTTTAATTTSVTNLSSSEDEEAKKRRTSASGFGSSSMAALFRVGEEEYERESRAKIVKDEKLSEESGYERADSVEPRHRSLSAGSGSDGYARAASGRGMPPRTPPPAPTGGAGGATLTPPSHLTSMVLNPYLQAVAGHQSPYFNLAAAAAAQHSAAAAAALLSPPLHHNNNSHHHHRRFDGGAAPSSSLAPAGDPESSNGNNSSSAAIGGGLKRGGGSRRGRGGSGGGGGGRGGGRGRRGRPAGSVNSGSGEKSAGRQYGGRSPRGGAGSGGNGLLGRDKVFTCNICYRSFGYKHVLQNHERTHTGEKPFECRECHKRFTRDHHLKTHMRLHTGEKPYSCTHCDRTFVQVANLRRHIRVHTGERPYKCELCPSAFSDSNQLKAHMHIHKGQSFSSLKDELLFRHSLFPGGTHPHLSRYGRGPGHLGGPGSSRFLLSGLGLSGAAGGGHHMDLDTASLSPPDSKETLSGGSPSQAENLSDSGHNERKPRSRKQKPQRRMLSRWPDDEYEPRMDLTSAQSASMLPELYGRGLARPYDEDGLEDGRGNGGVSPPSLGASGGVTIVGEYDNDHHEDEDVSYRGRPLTNSSAAKGRPLNREDEDVMMDEEDLEEEEDIDIDVDGDEELDDQLPVEGDHEGLEDNGQPRQKTSESGIRIKRPRVDGNCQEEQNEPEDLTFAGREHQDGKDRFEAKRLPGRHDVGLTEATDQKRSSAEMHIINESRKQDVDFKGRDDAEGVYSIGGNNNHSEDRDSAERSNGDKSTSTKDARPRGSGRDLDEVNKRRSKSSEDNDTDRSTNTLTTTTMECCDDFEAGGDMTDEEDYEEEDVHSGSSPSPSSLLEAGGATSGPAPGGGRSGGSATGTKTGSSRRRHHHHNSAPKELVGERLFTNHHQLFAAAATASTGGSIQLGLAGLSSTLGGVEHHHPDRRHHHHPAVGGHVGPGTDPAIVLRQQKEISQQ